VICCYLISLSISISIPFIHSCDSFPLLLLLPCLHYQCHHPVVKSYPMYMHHLSYVHSIAIVHTHTAKKKKTIINSLFSFSLLIHQKSTSARMVVCPYGPLIFIQFQFIIAHSLIRSLLMLMFIVMFIFMRVHSLPLFPYIFIACTFEKRKEKKTTPLSSTPF